MSRAAVIIDRRWFLAHGAFCGISIESLRRYRPGAVPLARKSFRLIAGSSLHPSRSTIIANFFSQILPTRNIIART